MLQQQQQNKKTQPTNQAKKTPKPQTKQNNIHNKTKQTQNISSYKGGGRERQSENDVWCIQKRNDINNSMNS